VRGTAGQVAAYIGPAGEPVYNSDAGAIHIQDGATAGGIRVARKDEVDAGLAGKAAALHTHDDRYYTETEADGRFVRVVDHNGTLTTAGTSTAYTIALGTAPATLSDGLSFNFTCDETNSGASTLVVTPNGGSAFSSKKLRKFVGSAEIDLVAGDLVANAHYMVQYDSAADGGSGAYIVLNPSLPRVVGRVNPSSSTLSVNVALPSGVSNFRIHGVVFHTAGTATAFYMRVSTDNGSSYKALPTDYRSGTMYNVGTSVTGTVTANSDGALLSGSHSITTLPIHVDAQLFRGTASLNASWTTRAGSYVSASSTHSNGITTGNVNSAGSVTHVQFYLSPGNMNAETNILIEALV
jgi:hypothetical protein